MSDSGSPVGWPKPCSAMHSARRNIQPRGHQGALPERSITIYSNTFESGVSDWDAFGSLFQAARVASGTHGIKSASGCFHAESGICGAACRWGGFNFGAGDGVPTAFRDYSTSVDIYLDVDGRLPNNTCFDFDSAINNAAGKFLRDYIFNAGFFTDSDGSPGSGGARYVISASNTGQPDGTQPKNPANEPIAIAASGWYTFEHHFYETSGYLTVDMSIFDSSRTLIKRWTIRSTDRIESIGGNSYGWFDYCQFSTLAFDNAVLRLNAPSGFGAAAPTKEINPHDFRQAVAY